MRLLIFFIGITIGLSTSANDGVAYINCTSTSTRTNLRIVTQELETLASLKFTIDGESMIFEANASHWWAFETSDQILILQAESENAYYGYQQIYFWAMPPSFNYLTKKPGELDLKFKAKVRGTDPRSTDKLITPTIDLNCRLTYNHD